MNLEERREFLRERAAALSILKKTGPSRPISPRLQKWRRRLAEQAKRVYVKPFFSLGIAMDDYQPVWVGQPNEKPRESLREKARRGPAAVTVIAEKLKPGANAPDVWWEKVGDKLPAPGLRMSRPTFRPLSKIT